MMATLNGNNKSASSSMDTELGRLLVDQRLATQDEINQCLNLRAKLPGEQVNQRTLADILIEQGVVTQRQITRVKQTIEETRTQTQQIPGYRIMGQIGAGAMATVYKARQISLDRIVAIKVLSHKLSENPEYVERFYREGKAAARLNHPNIVGAFDVGEANGHHYFVMEYVEGRTLYDELATGKVFSEKEALDIAIQIARALEHAHNQGLIHRDVKPKNIMLTGGGTAKLADMGLARAVADAQAAQAEAGRAFGTPYYISPEQIRGEINIDFRADIYSLGATLYHMITGKVPFEAATPVAVMQKHLKETLVPPDHLNTRISAGLGEVVEVMMAKDRDRRYGSTKDLLLDLEAIATGEPPLQARREFDTDVLTSLAGEAQTDLAPESQRGPEPAYNADLKSYLVILSVALGVSIIIIISLLIYLSAR